MKRNAIKYLGVLFLFLCMIHSCKKEKINKVELNNQFALSLFADTIKVGDLLNVLDSAAFQYLKVSPSGEISVCYADSIINAVTADDILGGLGDVTFELSEEFEIPSIPASPVPVPVEIPLENLFSIPFEYEGYTINYAVLKSGAINMNLSSNLDVLKELVLSTDNIELSDGSSFEVEVKLDNNGNQSVYIDLTDCKVMPVDGQIDFSVKMIMAISDQGIGGNYYFDVDGSVRNLKLKSLDGSIEDLSFDFEASKDIAVNINNLYGDLKVVKTQFNIKYLNTFGFLTDGYIESLYLSSDEGNVNVFKKYPVEILLHSTGDSYGYITDLDDKMVDFVDVLKPYKSFSFEGDIVMECEDVSEKMIKDDSHIDIIADLELPLQFNIDDLKFVDTIDFNLTLGDTEQNGMGVVENVFDELEFKFVFRNSLPLQIIPQIYMMENGIVIDSLFEEGSTISGNFGSGDTDDVLIVNVRDEKLHNIQNTDQLMLDISFTSLGNTVIINANDYFNLRLGLKTKTTEIYLDELNF